MLSAEEVKYITSMEVVSGSDERWGFTAIEVQWQNNTYFDIHIERWRRTAACIGKVQEALMLYVVG